LISDSAYIKLLWSVVYVAAAAVVVGISWLCTVTGHYFGLSAKYTRFVLANKDVAFIEVKDGD